MNWFGGRFVVCVAVLMVVSASALAQDCCCQQVSKKCHRTGEMRRCVNHDAACFPTGATCVPAATCCRPSATICGSETATSNRTVVDVVPEMDLRLRPLQDNTLPSGFYNRIGDFPPYWGNGYSRIPVGR